MKPSVAEAKKVRAAEMKAAVIAEMQIQLDRIEAKLDVILGAKNPQKASKTAKSETA